MTCASWRGAFSIWQRTAEWHFRRDSVCFTVEWSSSGPRCSKTSLRRVPWRTARIRSPAARSRSSSRTTCECGDLVYVCISFPFFFNQMLSRPVFTYILSIDSGSTQPYKWLLQSYPGSKAESYPAQRLQKYSNYNVGLLNIALILCVNQSL